MNLLWWVPGWSGDLARCAKSSEVEIPGDSLSTTQSTKKISHRLELCNSFAAFATGQHPSSVSILQNQASAGRKISQRASGVVR